MSFTIFQNKKTPFQAIKKTGSKGLKIDIFPNALSHGFGPTMGLFPTFFSAIQHRKMSLTIFQNKKTPFQAVKKRTTKSRKIDIFPKGLIHGFGLKMAIFETFFQAIQGSCKMSFTIFQNEKTPSQALKTRRSNRRKLDIFPKGLTYGFAPKMTIYPTFFFQPRQARKMSFTIFQNKKTPFQAIEISGSKSRKIDIFPWLWSKNAIFPTFFFRQYRLGKCLLRYSRTKKRLSRL